MHHVEMRSLTKEEVEYEALELVSHIDDGAVFIYPTDTIYGIGCDATSNAAVEKLREIKQMPDKPISIIAPGKEWIEENCVMNQAVKDWLKKLPGPYTLILKLKNKKAVSKMINPIDDSIGVRIPNHWISGFVAAYKKPICTTSANITGKAYMTTAEDLDPEVKKHISFCICEGEKKGKPSTIIHLEKEEIQIKKR